MKILLICIFIYAISAYAQYSWIRSAYSKGGVWENASPSRGDLFITFTPIVNTFGFVVGWVFYPPKGNSLSLGKFFNVKK